MIYIIVLLLLLIPAVRYDFLKKTNGREFWFYLELLVLVLLAGLRYRVGGDTLEYIDYFDDYPFFSELVHFDFKNAYFNPLWYVYNAILKSIFNDFILFQIIQSIFVNSVFFWFFRKYTKFYFTAILIYYIGYYLYFNMEILREVLCVCLFMISFKYIESKKYLIYVFFGVLSYLIHHSAVVMFFIPFFMKLPKIKWTTTLASFLLLTIFLSYFDIVPILISLFSGNEKLLSKTIAYTSLESSILNINGVIAYFLPIILLLYSNTNKVLTEFQIKIEKLLLLYVLLIALSIFIPTMFSRMQNYLEPFYIIYLVDTLFSALEDTYKSLKMRSYIIKFAFIFYVFIIYKSYTVDRSEYMIGKKSYNIYYPYHSIFDPVVETDREKFVEYFKEGNS